MKILLQWQITNENREAILSALAAGTVEDYLAQWAVPNVKTLGRWHDPVNGKSLAILETDNPDAVAALVLSWNSLAQAEMSFVLDDHEIHEQARRHVAAPGPWSA